MQQIVPMVAHEDAAAANVCLTEEFGFREKESARDEDVDAHRWMFGQALAETS